MRYPHLASLVLCLAFAALPNIASATPKSPSPGISITPPAEYLVTELGDSQTFSVALSAAPQSKVILKLTSSDLTEGTLNVQELTFLRENWNTPQQVIVTGVDDDAPDGDRKFTVSVALKYTKDAQYQSIPTQELTFECLDDESSVSGLQNVVSQVATTGKIAPQKVKLRIMTANTTTGEDQSYDNGEGIRIFKALKPDIVLIQEFNYNKNSIKSFVSSTFGKEYQYSRGTGDIPNGIISRYPILESGSWKSNRVTDRQWEWAVIDIPGARDLLAVSVHLYTQDNEAEMEPLKNQIAKKIAADKKDYYVILGGDFNQPDWNPIQKHFGQMFEVGKRYEDWPSDQDGLVKTNVTRHKQIDYLLCNPDFCALETPTVVGTHSYPKGHVVDSRVYKKHGELKDIAPIKADDSEAHKMQHMAVIRDFEYVPLEK